MSHRRPTLQASLGMILQLCLVSTVLPHVSHANGTPEQVVTYPEDIQWKPVVAPDAKGRGIFVFMLYGELGPKDPTAFLMKYSAGRRATPHIHGSDYYAVVVSGRFKHFINAENEHTLLTPGATWYQKGNGVHDDYCEGPEDCVLDVFFPEGFDVTFVGHQ